MIGLDTNVLVRYLVDDDPGQGAKAAAVIERAAARHSSLLINTVVLSELIWVLESAYVFGRAEIATVIEQLLTTAELEVEQKDTAWLALADYRGSKDDFADCVIGRQNRRLGCDTTVTFDRDLKQLDTFDVL
jgi:predicted nucleic-acid-binding protein